MKTAAEIALKEQRMNFRKESKLAAHRSFSRLFRLCALLISALGAGLYYWTSTCPCDRTPGLVLFGDTQQDPVLDWTFANDAPLCQIQIGAGLRPHAVNLNCMATPAGALYLSCSVCETKYWASHVEQNEKGRLRINGKVYPVTLNRVIDESILDRAWKARVQKLQTFGEPPYNPAPPLDAQRPEHWWSFAVTSRPA